MLSAKDVSHSDFATHSGPKLLLPGPFGRLFAKRPNQQLFGAEALQPLLSSPVLPTAPQNSATPSWKTSLLLYCPYRDGHIDQSEAATHFVRNLPVRFRKIVQNQERCGEIWKNSPTCKEIGFKRVRFGFSRKLFINIY